MSERKRIAALMLAGALLTLSGCTPDGAQGGGWTEGGDGSGYRVIERDGERCIVSRQTDGVLVKECVAE